VTRKAGAAPSAAYVVDTNLYILAFPRCRPRYTILCLARGGNRSPDDERRRLARASRSCKRPARPSPARAQVRDRVPQARATARAIRMGVAARRRGRPKAPGQPALREEARTSLLRERSPDRSDVPRNRCDSAHLGASRAFIVYPIFRQPTDACDVRRSFIGSRFSTCITVQPSGWVAGRCGNAPCGAAQPVRVGEERLSWVRGCGGGRGAGMAAGSYLGSSGKSVGGPGERSA
jgi:hypothetical protein